MYSRPSMSTSATMCSAAHKSSPRTSCDQAMASLDLAAKTPRAFESFGCFHTELCTAHLRLRYKERTLHSADLSLLAPVQDNAKLSLTQAIAVLPETADSSNFLLCMLDFSFNHEYRQSCGEAYRFTLMLDTFTSRSGRLGHRNTVAGQVTISTSSLPTASWPAGQLKAGQLGAGGV